MRLYSFLILGLFSISLLAQEIDTPLRKKNYARPTSYDELTVFIKQLDESSSLLTTEVLGTSVKGRNLYLLKFSSGIFGKDRSKIKVLIIAQQHGNEQSGKEGALLLANELLKTENRYLFDRIDLAVVPQMNPDGSEENKRLNGNEMDLNRNHLIITEPEIIAIHHLFNKYLFEVTMDVHEYFPYSEKWKKFGYRDNTDEFLGTTNNINIALSIKDLSDKSFMPFMKEYFTKRQITNFVYCPGGPPGIDYLRRSTFDVNDGRQSFGIQNTFSFIQEGMNGKDNYAENINHRARGQMTGMRGLLEYAYQNKSSIMKMVTSEREKLTNEEPGKDVSIQSVHVRNGEKLSLPVRSYFSEKDSVIIVDDWRPEVKSLCDVKKPSGYLIPKQLKEVADWAGRHELKMEVYTKADGDIIEQYDIIAIDSIDFERDMIADPKIFAKELPLHSFPDDYIYIPTSQLKGNMIVLALEPKSMLGLVTYKNFAHLLKKGDKYAILRVIRK